jgi:hypothetical protein
MADKDFVIRFSAQVYKIQTTIDMGIRITLDMGEGDTDIAKKLMDIRRAGGLLEIAAVPVKKVQRGRKRTKTDGITDDSGATY